MTELSEKEMQEIGGAGGSRVDPDGANGVFASQPTPLGGTRVDPGGAND